MSLESAVAALNENVVAMNANFEAILARLNSGDEPAKPKADKVEKEKPAEKPSEKSTAKGSAKASTSKKSKSEFSEDEVKAMAVQIKDKFGTGEAKKLIKNAGKADSLAEIDPENYDAFMEACQAKLDPKGGGDDDEDDDI